MMGVVISGVHFNSACIFLREMTSFMLTFLIEITVCMTAVLDMPQKESLDISPQLLTRLSALAGDFAYLAAYSLVIGKCCRNPTKC